LVGRVKVVALAATSKSVPLAITRPEVVTPEIVRLVPFSPLIDSLRS
jgi:hypothetical protein